MTMTRIPPAPGGRAWSARRPARPSRGRVPMKRIELLEVRDAITSAFNLSTLDQMLRFRLDGVLHLPERAEQEGEQKL